MSTILYPSQQEVVSKVLKFLPRFKFQLITGEVGSGKTYMGADVAYNLSKQYDVLIVVPAQTVDKWNDVVSLTFDARNEKVKHVTIIPRSSFSEDVATQFEVVIYDECHTLKSQVKFLSNIVYFVGLTGSIIDKKVDDITNLTNAFSRYFGTFPEYRTVSSEFRHDRARFVRLFVQLYLAHGISRDDARKSVENLEKTEAPVTVHELSVKMSSEETAFYNFAQRRMSSLSLPESRQMRLLNEHLDRVSKENTFTLKGLKYFVGDRIITTSVEKDTILRQYLDDIKEPVLVYSLDDSLAKRLAADIENLTFFDSREFTNSAEKDINDLLRDNKHVVVNISRIQTGIDLNSNYVIWYQTPLKLSQDIQGTGRITRLSSDQEEKHVYYLYHQNTKQEALVKLLKQTRELNNEMIKKRDESTVVSNVPFLVNKV